MGLEEGFECSHGKSWKGLAVVGSYHCNIKLELTIRFVPVQCTNPKEKPIEKEEVIDVEVQVHGDLGVNV